MNSVPGKKLVDSEEDQTFFEICVINKNNSGLLVTAVVKNANVYFG